MVKRKRQPGTGSIYQQRGTSCWSIQYYSATGQRVREATGFHSRQQAQDLLNQRLAAVSKGEPVGLVKPQRIAALYDYMVTYYKAKGRRVETARWRKHLAPAFAHVLAPRLTTQMTLDYRLRRQEQKAACATINRELAMLRRMYKLGHQCSPPLVAVVPYFPIEEENNVRTGFTNDQQLDQLRSGAKELWLRTLVELAAMYGWRRGELLGLCVSQVDFEHNTIRLDPGTTKNKEGRTVPLTPAVRTLLQECCHGKKPTDKVLTRDGGSPVRDPRVAWWKLTCSAGLGAFVCCGCGHQQLARCRCPKCKARKWKYSGLLVHDMRRTAVRNLRRAHVDEHVAMKISGHKTPSMYRRYNIVDNADTEQAVQQLLDAEAARRKAAAEVERQAAQQQQRDSAGHSSAIVGPLATQKLQ